MCRRIVEATFHLLKLKIKYNGSFLKAFLHGIFVVVAFRTL